MTNLIVTSDESSDTRSKKAKQNFGLTEEEFNILIEKVKNEDESFFKHIYNYHSQACIAFLKRKYKISQDQGNDLFMDALLIFRNKILDGKIKYGNLEYLFTRIASNIFVDSYRKMDRINDAIKVFVDDEKFDSTNEDHFFEVLEKTISTLEKRHQTLINDIFYSGKDVYQIAENHNISYATLRKRKERLLSKIKTSFINLLKST